MADEKNINSLITRKGLSPNLVDAVRDILAGKKVEAEIDDENAAELATQEEGKKLSSKEKMKRGLYNSKLDPVNTKALKGKHKDRADKDIDNDGDVDSSDKYLHRRRKKVMKSINTGNNMTKVMKEEEVGEGNEYNVSVKGEGGVRVKAKTPKHAASKAFQKLGVAQRHRSTIQHTVKPHTEDTDVEEGAMSRIATQSAEKKRLGADKVKGTGLDTFKKKPAKDTMIANPKTQKVRKVTPSRAKMAVKKGFVYAEHMEGLEEDAFKGQPTGVSVTMKHKDTGKKVSTKFPGTHSAVAGAKSHIAQMQKKGYAVHSKNLMYGKNEAYDTPAVKKPVSQMTPAEKKKNDERRTAYNTFQKRKRDKESVNEARRGRPPKASAAGTQDTETRHNIIHQLRKSVSLRGQYKVEFKDGKQHKITAGHASQALNKYNTLRTTGEKSNYQKQLHHSHDSFHTARQSKTPGAPEPKRGVSLGGSDRLKKLMSKYK
jgi:hypothetical protein